MLRKAIIAVCSENRKEHTNLLCGQKVGVLNVKRGGT
jgi:hypothetical protein